MADTQDEAELALSEDDSLPWLESDESEEEGGLDAAQIVIFAGGLLLLTAAIVGGLFWWTNRSGDQAAVADGSTIEAPAAPYKERPDDPGGKEFAGTGDVAPGVGEGQSREGRLREGSAGGAGGSTAGEASGSKTTKVAGPSISTRSTEEVPVEQAGVGVQVGAYSTRADAETGWVTLRGQTTALNGVRHRVTKGQADIGTVYRLQAVAGNLSAARDLCRRLKGDGVPCQVKQ